MTSDDQTTSVVTEVTTLAKINRQKQDFFVSCLSCRSSSPLIAIPAYCERNPADCSKFKYDGRYFGYSEIRGCIQHVFLRMQNCVPSYAKRVTIMPKDMPFTFQIRGGNT
jgi:hypothetical protein